MKKQSVLEKQRVKKRLPKKTKEKIKLPDFTSIRWIGPVLVKCFLFFVIIAGTSLSLMYCYHLLLTSPYLRLEKVEVTGVGKDLRNDLIDICNTQFNVNLLALNMDELKHKLEGHPWIRSIRLKRQFPHGLVVTAEEQTAFALVAMDKTYLMNQHCEVFKQIDKSDDIDLPIITGISGQNQNTRLRLQRATQIIRVLETQEKPWSLQNLSEIHVNNEGVSLYFNHLTAKIDVVGNNLKYKLTGLNKVTRHLRKTGRIQQVTRIDLNSTDGAVVSFRKG